MSRENFRDLYSARREGTLEAGLTGVFDETLKTNADLREDYAAFCAACEDLDLGAKEVIAAPEWLSARILDRLDSLPAANANPFGRFSLRGLFRSAGPFSLSSFSPRSLGLAGLGALALLGAGFAVWRGTDGSTAMAGVVGSTGDVPAAAGDTLRPVIENGRVFIDFQSPGVHSVGIFAAPEGALLKRYPVGDAQRLHSELVNRHSVPFAFEIRVDREARPLLVVIPGTARNRDLASGTGDLILFAKALAQTYGTPVALHVDAPTTAVTWNLTGPQSQSEALKSVEGLNLTIDAMPGGLLSIQDR